MQDPSAPLTTHTDSTGEFVIYNTEDGRTEVQLRFIDGSVWMTQAEMSELFDVTRASISAHLTNIYSENELTRDRTIKKFLTVRSEGDRNVTRSIDHYNLDAIMAVGSPKENVSSPAESLTDPQNRKADVLPCKTSAFGGAAGN
ncbi:hypothetical protein ACUY3P_11750 [Corynebacterium lehmanniae]